MDFIRLSSLFAFALVATTASADTVVDPTAAFQAALGSRTQSIGAVSGGDMKRASQMALNTVVDAGIQALRDNGDHRIADQYEDDWKHHFADYFVRPSVLDLGDHKALSQWLANFYVKLEDRLGTATIHNGFLGDIYAMNYAIPIVFAPKGDWRSTTTPNRDWVEYRKHFIPFANVVTYWAANLACNYVMKKQGAGSQGKKLCAQASEKLRFAMGRYVAPKISDFIFNKASGVPATLSITDQDLQYLSAQDLVDAIQNGGA